MAVSTFLIGDTNPRLYCMTDYATRNDLPLAEVMQWAEHDPLWANRGKAIQGYASLEGSLCGLLVAVSGTPWDAAVTIFYKITNTTARNAILEKLLHKKFGAKFNAFWNPLIKEIAQMDRKRNEIVHWLAAANILLNSNQQMLVGVTLVPPASVRESKSVQHITSRDLSDYARKCDEIARLLNMFCERISPSSGTSAEGEPWFDIFQLPFVYPLPEGHPILPKISEPEIHPRSFPMSVQLLEPAPDGLHLKPWNPS